MPLLFTRSDCQIIKLMIHLTKEWLTWRKHLPSDTSPLYSLYCDTLVRLQAKAYRKRLSRQYGVGKHRVHRAKSSTHCQGKSWPYEQKLLLEGMEIEDPGNLFYLMYNHVVRVQSIKSKQLTFCTFRQVYSSPNRCCLQERESDSCLHFSVDKLSAAFNFGWTNN